MFVRLTRPLLPRITANASHGIKLCFLFAVFEASLSPMFWRFAVAADERVELFIVRDADSRLTPRDASAVGNWVGLGQVNERNQRALAFHCIRDHPSHSLDPVNGGLWGAQRVELATMFNGRQV